MGVFFTYGEQCRFLLVIISIFFENGGRGEVREVSGAGPYISMCDLLPDILAGGIAYRNLIEQIRRKPQTLKRIVSRTNYDDMWWFQISF